MSNPLYDELRTLLDSPSADAVREQAVQAGRRIWAFCPCHADGTKFGKRSPSLHPRYGLECFAGCSFRDVVRTIRERGGVHLARPVPTQTVRHKRSRRPELGDVVASWVYQDEEGQSLFRVVRLEGLAGKTFLQQHPSGSCANHIGDPCKPAGAGWRWGRGGAQFVLFRLYQLLTSPLDEMTFVVEGERCADSLVGLGLIATTSPGGAGKWRDEYAEALRGRSVCVLPDGDGPGADHAEDIIKSLLSVAAEVRSIVLPGLGHKQDIFDWLAAGGNREQLLALVSRAPVMRAPSTEFPKAIDVRVLDASGESA